MSSPTKRFGIFRSLAEEPAPPELSETFETTMFHYPIDSQNPESMGTPKSQLEKSPPPLHLLPSFLSKPAKASNFPSNLKVPKDQNFSKIDSKPMNFNERKLLTPNPAAFRSRNSEYDSSLNSSGNYSNASFSMIKSTEESSREESDRRRKPKKRPLEENEKNLYVIRLEMILYGKDIRTTVMIKNIPNKYTQRMLLSTIDKKFERNYDFLYLPIDFKVIFNQNKCNVGYAFINFVSPFIIVEFFKEFDGKRWERFNSEKVCQLAYARIQGLSELLSHFRNSSVINQEDNKVKPVIFGKN